MADEALKIFRLIPDAAETDPNWDLAQPAGEVVVRARSAADARILAAEAEVDFLDTSAKPGDGVSTTFASAFRDQRLYRVVEDESGTFPSEGPRTVLSRLERPDPVKHGGR
jgi:hypothetical protein